MMPRSSQLPVDLTHIDRYTGGDTAINEEVLRLFDRQCREILDRLDDLLARGDSSKGAEDWHHITHALKGAARGIGAVALAEAAAEAEKIRLPDKLTLLPAVERLKTSAEAVHLFIQAFLDKTD